MGLASREPCGSRGISVAQFAGIDYESARQGIVLMSFKWTRPRGSKWISTHDQIAL